jgi:glycosyltransferase involved in cell wall biosynthesis
MMSAPLVTALIPAYNAEKTIMRALESVWAQDYQPIEIVVIDDGSKDGTRAILAGLAQRGVRLVALDQNRGECGAMNAGLEAARGEYIAFLDADDEWLPGKITRQVAALQAEPNTIFVVCDSRYYRGAVPDPKTVFEEVPPMAGREAWRSLLRESFVAKPCVMARRGALMAMGGFNAALRVAGDQDMWIRLALVGGVGILREVLVNVHDTPGSLMKAYPRGALEFLLPMVMRHAKAERQRLTIAEYDGIVSHRYVVVGSQLYRSGYAGQALGFFIRAIRHGASPGRLAAFMLRESGPVIWLKRTLRPLRAAL